MIAEHCKVVMRYFVFLIFISNARKIKIKDISKRISESLYNGS
ncbi:MAG: hypothetical protein BAJALOKI2v1_880018 [Promethearchaeota archaeon]|nr:MAG: hypothetical protein BAJALOKI2v1_880018 [Candidatus Lokiarchaeota archaeon]